MKKLLYIFATAALTMTMSCGNSEKAGQSEKSVEDSLRADSIKKVEMAIEAQRQDSIRQDSIRQDSLRRYRVTPDLALFNLHGPVKSVTFNKGIYADFVKTMTFSKDGKLQSVARHNITRNGKGIVKRLSKPSDFGSIPDALDFTCDKQNRPVSVFVGGHEYGYTNRYTYDAKGFIASESCKGAAESLEFNDVTRYKYLNVDKYGNWTSRKATEVETTIDLCDEESGPMRKTTTRTETRTITYYE